MQQKQYDEKAAKWSVENKNACVGFFDEHNNWQGYELLFKDIIIKENARCLDFGCGPGRNIVKYNNLFKYIDGVDISAINLKNAEVWLKHNGCDTSKTRLYKCNGIDLSEIISDQYDMIISTICLQHICVHDIRYGYFKEFYRILNKDGYFSAQMGYGPCKSYVPFIETFGYHENYYDAKITNGGCDTRVDSPEELKNDLESIGFKNFTYYLTDSGPGGLHEKWIFFHCQK